MNRRAIKMIVLLLVGGAIVNVAVAWGWHSSSRRVQTDFCGVISIIPSDPVFWRVAVSPQFGSLTIEAVPWRYPTPDPMPILPPWSIIHTPPLPGQVEINEYAIGWPLFCLYSRNS